MNVVPSYRDLHALHSDLMPRIFDESGDAARLRFLDFFAVQIRNPNTRRAYYQACRGFLDWAFEAELTLQQVAPRHVAIWLELQKRRYSPASVKQHLAAVKMLFDWLVTGHVVRTSPASSVRSPRYSIRKGKTPVLAPDEALQLLDSIGDSSIVRLRDRALIGIMIYSFARIGAALAMKVEDVYVQNRRLWIRLHEKGGKLHDMPCHHQLEEWLDAYINAAGIADEPQGWLIRSVDRNTKRLNSNPLAHANAYAMVKRRGREAGLKTEITNHSFRATGITAYLSNGGTLEQAARMANHASTRTTQLYDRRDDRVTLGEVEKIRL